MGRMPACFLVFASLAAFLPAASGADDGVIRSAKNGPWSAAETWAGGKVPAAGARVHVLPGHTVTYDVQSDDVIRAINVAGTLRFARNRDTLLNTGLIKIEMNEKFSEEGFDCDHFSEEPDKNMPRATLEIGTPNEPIPANHKAVIRLHHVEGLDPQSCPAIVCCAGQMDFHGAPLSRTWVKLGATAKKDTAEVVLADEVTGWQVGDQVVITSTNWDDQVDDASEPRTIQAIEGTKITLDQPLKYDHLGEGDERGEIANLSRNVIVESAEPAGVRGHTMYHRGSAGAISYAEFRHLGKKDTLGRYSLHFHLCGNSMRGSYVVGASIWDSHNRWLTIHGTNYLVARDNVGYQSVGHGFFLEDGTEIYNLLDRNLAIAARRGKRLPKQVLPFDQNEGAGFWWSNSLNTFTRNVAADCGEYGFRLEATPSSSFDIASLEVMQPDGSFRKTDIRTLPFVRFEGNEVHSSSGLYGINLGEGVRGVGPDTKHPFIVRSTKIWNVHYGLRPQVPSLLVENISIKSHYGVYHPNFDNHVYRHVTIRHSHTEPFNRGHDDDSRQDGVLAVDGLVFDSCGNSGMPLIQISDDNSNGTAESHFRGVQTVNWSENNRRRQAALVNLGGGPRPQPKTAKGVPVYLHDYYGEGRTALVVSTRSPEYKADPGKFREDAPLTGDESRVAEVSGVEFPELLAPVDDLPPQTVITHVIRQKDGKVLVRGTASDNGEIKRVVVNGQNAKLDVVTGQWETLVTISDDDGRLSAYTEDIMGNVERMPHVVNVAGR
ncbi:MAG TPA: G8 domain-containing protein [Pirellulaceae bacterium]|nr:G8 domain-containing protein [Pirellulaceae bacterium]